MSKFIIEEEKLNSILEECFEEVMLEEGVFDRFKEGYQNFKNNGGFAGAAGRAYQRTRNSIANAKKDFEFGRAAERAKNVDYDPLKKYVDKYGADFAKKMVDQLGDRYGQNRYSKMTDVRQGKTIPQNDEPSAYPNLTNTAATQTKKPYQAPSATATPSKKPYQAPNATAQPQVQASGWGNMDNAQYMDEAVQNAVSNALRKMINEIGNTKDGQRALGAVSARSRRRATDAKNNDDHEGFIKNMKTCVAADAEARDERIKKYGEKKVLGGNENNPMSKAFKDGEHSRLNEVGDTVNGQKKLGKLAGKRLVQYWKADDTGDEKGVADFERRYKNAKNKASSERNSTDSSNKRRKMNKAFHKSIQKQVEKLSEEVNEVGDTLKGQYKLGRLYADRMAKAKDLNEPIDSASRAHDFDTKWDLKDKQDNLFYRAHNAYNKANDERMSGPMPMFPSNPKGKMMRNSYWVGEDIGMIKNKLEALKQKMNDRKNGTKEELNELGDTEKGQFKLGRLSQRQAERGDEDTAAVYARKERGDYKPEYNYDEKGKKKWSRMTDAFLKGTEKERKANKKTVNEIGDTLKGQEKLGRIDGRRHANAYAAGRKMSKSLDPDEEEMYRKERNKNLKAGVDAYVKARDERDNKFDDGNPAKMQMWNAYSDGQRKEFKRQTKKNKKAGN